MRPFSDHLHHIGSTYPSPFSIGFGQHQISYAKGPSSGTISASDYAEFPHHHRKDLRTQAMNAYPQSLCAQHDHMPLQNHLLPEWSTNFESLTPNAYENTLIGGQIRLTGSERAFASGLSESAQTWAPRSEAWDQPLMSSTFLNRAFPDEDYNGDVASDTLPGPSSANRSPRRSAG